MNAFRLLLFVLALTASVSSGAQTHTQSFDLRPGWNAVWIEVDPPNRSPASVFAGLPIQSVWTWSDRVSATDFIQNPGDAGWNRAQWLSYFPEGSPETVLSNLRAVLPQRAYLLKLGGTQPVRWSVSGLPIVRYPSWAPDAYNLRGFPVDPSIPPSFRSFFRPSPAHYDASADRLEKIFTLGSDGTWTEVSPDAVMQRGVAYWVHARGTSDYVAPFHLELNTGDVIDFDATERRVGVVLHNRLALAKDVQIKHLVTHDSHLLLIQSPLSGSTNLSKTLGTHTQLVVGATSHQLIVGLDRSKLPPSQPDSGQPALHTSLLALSDGEGTSYTLGARAFAGPSQDFVGLWLGTAMLTNVVSVPDSGDLSGSGTVPMAFPLRVLLHVDSNGQVSLLRDVTLLYAATNAPSTNAGVPATVLSSRPTRLLTDPAILASLPPLDIRAGRITGRRITAPHFDFALNPGQFQLPLVGTMAVSNQVSGVMNLPSELPTNPFLHRYHPDHGTNHAYGITRAISMSFDMPFNISPGEGDEALGGTYSEVITGLHKLPLSTSGSLALRRISNVGTLNAP